MATLKELMGDLKRGDGRMFFNLIERFTFEPIFKAHNYWYGLKLNGDSYCANHEESNAWDSDIEPKPKKKLKMYSPIYMNKSGNGYFMEDGWSSSKNDFDQFTINPIVGWQEMEVEVDE
jgi:hypothetical protein